MHKLFFISVLDIGASLKYNFLFLAVKWLRGLEGLKAKAPLWEPVFSVNTEFTDWFTNVKLLCFSLPNKILNKTTVEGHGLIQMI